MEKIYITFGSAHVERNAARGLPCSMDGWWEVEAPSYAVARAVADAAFQSVYAFDYTESNWDPHWYPLGCIGTISIQPKEGVLMS